MSTDKKPEDVINDLIKKAGAIDNGPDAALKYSQAAVNVANALRVVVDTKNAATR